MNVYLINYFKTGILLIVPQLHFRQMSNSRPVAALCGDGTWMVCRALLIAICIGHVVTFHCAATQMPDSALLDSQRTLHAFAKRSQCSYIFLEYDTGGCSSRIICWLPRHHAGCLNGSKLASKRLCNQYYPQHTF